MPNAILDPTGSVNSKAATAAAPRARRPASLNGARVGLLINTKQNDIFTVLTIVSVVGIPPTLVASIYGMNFKNMPELDWAWGYQFGLALIVLSTILPILWFKWRGWL